MGPCGLLYTNQAGDASSVHVPSLARGEASYLAGIFARFRAMASSTAFSCFNSSSRRDSVLLGLLEPDPDPDPEPEPGRAGLPDGAAGPLPDDLGGGDRGRFLSPWGGTGRGPCPRGRSMRGDSGDRRGIRFSRPPRSGEKAILLLGGEPGRFLSEDRYLFLLLSACCCLLRRVSLMSLWEPEPPRLPGGPMTPGGGCGGWTPLLGGPDLWAGFPPLGKGTGASIFLRSSRKGSSFFRGLSALPLSRACGARSRGPPRSLLGWLGVGERELAEDTGLARSAYMSSESALRAELLPDDADDTDDTLLTLKDLDFLDPDREWERDGELEDLDLELEPV